MSLPNEFIEKVKNANNIVDVAARYMQIVRKGRGYWACCPFHHEKTPSFAINEQDQYYHCFGCGKSGNIIKLVEQLENVDFLNAVELLAKWANIEMPKTAYDPYQLEQAKKRTRILEIIDEARKIYIASLDEPTRKYLAGRGVTAELTELFNIGKSPDWDTVIKQLKIKGYTEAEILDAGVAAKSEKGRIYDAMGERITFPIFDLYGNCIGFTGRISPDKDNGQVAKYRNTSQTQVFDKGRIVYGSDVLKKHIRKESIASLIVVEGNVDVITLVGAGFHNTVACMGTAMTPFHAKAFKRFSDQIHLCFDGDTAGQKATMRSLDILAAEALDVRVVSLPADADPDDFVKKSGAEAFKKLLTAAVPATDHKLDTLKNQSNLADNLGKAKYLNAAIEILKSVAPLELELYSPKIAAAAGVSVDGIIQAARQGAKTAAPAVQKEPAAHSTNGSSATLAFNFVAASFFHKKDWADEPLAFDFDYDQSDEKITNFEFKGTFGELRKYYSDCVAILMKEYKKKLRDDLTKQFNETQDMEILKIIGNLTKEIKND